MKKIILLMILFILHVDIIFSNEVSIQYISHIELFSIDWHSRPNAMFSIQLANETLIFTKFSNASEKYIVKNELKENFKYSKITSSAFYNAITDSTFCNEISDYIDDYKFKDIDLSEYPCRTLCNVVYSDGSVKYVSFFYDEMIINGHKLKRDNSLLKQFFPYLPEYYVKSIKYYVDRTEEGLE